MAISDYPSASRFTRLLENQSTARIISMIVIPVLIIAALLLPPISVVERIQDAGKIRVSTAGGVVSDPDGTQVTFLPGTVRQPFRAQMQSVPRTSFVGSGSGQETAAAANAIPAHLVAKSPFYQLTLRGQGATQSNWIIPIPNDSEPYQTLDVYTWNAVTKSWQWLPHSLVVDDDLIEARVPFVPTSAMVMQTNPLPAVVSADAKVASMLPTESQGALGEVHPTGLYLGGNGAVEGAIDANFSKLGKSFGVVPVVRNHDGPVVRTDLLANMLIDPAQRNGHIEALVNIAVTNLYNGVDIDYRGLDPALRTEFTQFVSQLAQKLHAQNKRLAVRVEAPAQVAEDRWETGAYDWMSIGRLADVVKVPAPVNPQAYVAGGQIDSLLAFATGQVDRYKLELSLAGQSVEQAGNYLLLKSYNDALQPLVGRVEVTQPVVAPGASIDLALVSTHANSGLVFDPNIGTYVYRYKDDQGNARTVWLENAASLSHKLKLIGRYNIRGFTVENLPADGLDKDLWPLIRNFQQGKADPINNSFMVEWTIRSSSGEVLREMRGLNEGATNLKAPQAPGEIQIQAALVDRGQVFSTRNAVGAVATHTPTPSPTPQYTPTPEPSATPVATATPSVAQFLVTSDTLNVRAGPDTAYPKVAELKRGDRKEITGKNEAGSWYQFKLENGSGWVSAQMVSVGGPLAALKVAQAEALPTAEPKPTSAAAAVTPPPAVRLPTTSTGFGYGMQVDPWGGHISAVKGAGMNWVKFQVPWTLYEGSKGAKGFNDDQVNQARANGLNVLASIVKSPAWARNPAFMRGEGPPQNPQDFADYVGAYAAHFCGKVQAIEVWNEQNMDYEWGYENLDPVRYMNLLKLAYNAIKGNCPSMLVISGAPTPAGHVLPRAYDDRAYLEAMYQNGLKNYSDGIGAHPSGFANPPDVTFQDFQAGRYSAPSHANHPSFYMLNTLQDYRNIMVKYGDGNKRVWPTEFGWGSTSAPHPGYEYEARVTEQMQADYIVRAFGKMRSLGFVGPAFLWCLDYNVTQPATELAAFGVLGRPAYSAIQNMAK